MKIRFARILTCILLLAVLSACAPEASQPASTAAPQPTTETTPTDTLPATGSPLPYFEAAGCPFPLPPGQVEGASMDCGYLVVPENRAGPAMRSIRLAVAVFHPAEGAQHPDPILYLSGGPGGSALKTIVQSYEPFAAVVDALQRDLILFDQRGVGFSEPALDCPGAISLGLELLDFELDGQPVTQAEVSALIRDEYIACGEDLSALADLSAYHSAASAADVNDLRTALGYEQVNLWGGSYGTRLALTVMRDFPEAVRSVVLDAVYPPEADLYLEAPLILSRALNQLFDRCAMDTACSAAYPELKKTFFETVSQLNAEPAIYQIIDPASGQTYDVQMNGDSLIGVMFQFLYLTDVIPMLPQLITDMHAGDFTLLAGIRSQLLLLKDMSSVGMQFSVQCSEEIPFSSKSEFLEALSDFPQLASFYQTSLVGLLTYDVCQAWPAGRAAPVENLAVLSDIPALLMTSEFDPIAYPDWGAKVAAELENAYFFDFPAFGHGSSLFECPRSMVIDFIDNPGAKPDSACMQEISLSFVLPAQLAEIDLATRTIQSSGIEALLPEGWLEVYDYYLVSPDRKIELVVKKETGITPEAFLAKWGTHEEPVNEIQGEHFTWQVYPLHLQDAAGSAAGYVYISPLEDGFYMVLGIGAEAQQKAIGEHLLTPIAMSFTLSGE